MRTRLLLVVSLIAAGSASTARGGEPDDALWQKLVDAKHPGHAAAVLEWDRLEAVDRLARVRAGLASKDESVARFAAELADPFTLNLEELRRAAQLCAADPAWVADPFRKFGDGLKANGLGFGMPDIVSMWRIAANTEGFAFKKDEKSDGDASDEFHRATDASMAKDLVPLLETKNDAVRKELAEDLNLIANITTRDETRPTFARGALYILARAEAVKAGKPIPSLASIEVADAGPGVPLALKALIREELRKSAEEAWAQPWLVRWARSTAPVAEDLPFLEDIVRTKHSPDAFQAWAMRGLAALDPKGERTHWPALAEGKDGLAAMAAAELARQGHPARLRALAVDAEKDDLARMLSWDSDPEAARARYLAGIEMAESSSEVEDLSPGARADVEMAWGVRIRDADLRAIGAALVEGGTPRKGCAWFFTRAIPEAITPEVARVLAKRLAALSDENVSGPGFDGEEPRLTLGVLEARAPDVVLDLLSGWAERPKGDLRDEALVVLARLGDVKRVDAMLASWIDPEHEGWSMDSPVLGRVKDARVTAFLRGRVSARPADEAEQIEILALAVALGIPDSYRSVLTPSRGEKHPEVFQAFRTKLLAGDVKGAMRPILERGWGLEGVGALNDPEALEIVRKIRRDRFVGEHASYWNATKGLAAAGDADARREWLGFLRDGRVRMNDSHDLLLPGLLATDPEVLATMISLLDSNCCLGFQAYAGLTESYPTAPIDNIGPMLGRNRVAAERWFAQHRGTFVWSRILDAYVPGPAAK